MMSADVSAANPNAAGFVPPAEQAIAVPTAGEGLQTSALTYNEVPHADEPSSAWTVNADVLPAVPAERRPLIGRFVGRIATGAHAVRDYAPAVTAGLVPGLHYLVEDPTFVLLQNRAMEFMSRFPHGAGSLATTAALGIAMLSESYGAGRWANTAPRVAKSYENLENLSSNPVVRVGQTALAYVKKPFEWAGAGMQKVGGKLEESEHASVRIAGSILWRTGLVNALGVPGAAVQRKKMLIENGASPDVRVPKEEILKDATAFSASWFAGYWALRGVYMGLNAIDNATKHPAFTAALRVPMHLISEGFADVSSDPSKLPCQIAIGALVGVTTMMGANAGRAVHRQRRGDAPRLSANAAA